MDATAEPKGASRGASHSASTSREVGQSLCWATAHPLFQSTSNLVLSFRYRSQSKVPTPHVPHTSTLTRWEPAARLQPRTPTVAAPVRGGSFQSHVAKFELMEFQFNPRPSPSMKKRERSGAHWGGP